MYHTYNWAVLELHHKDEVYYKVLAQVDAGMNGWRINSGITKVTEDEEHFYFHGSTNSTYKCAKDSERLGRTTQPIFDRIKEYSDVSKVIKAVDIKSENLLK